MNNLEIKMSLSLCFFLHSNSHNQKVQMHMMDLMSSIIMEGDGVTQELLDTILINLIPAHKVGQHNYVVPNDNIIYLYCIIL